MIPTYRRERAVVAAATSALRQADVEVEVIVLDDTAENTARAAIAGLADQRVQYVPCDTPTGGIPARLRNRGLAMARTEYVHFLDDDDELEPGALGALAAALERSPRAGAAIGVVVPVGGTGTDLERERAYFDAAARRLRACRHPADLVARLLFGNAPLVCSACMVRRCVAEAVGGFAEDVQRVEDGEFYLRAVRHSGFTFVDRPVVRYQTGQLSRIHASDVGPALIDGYRTMHARYRREHGVGEFMAVRLLSVWQHGRERVANHGDAHRPAAGG